MPRKSTKSSEAAAGPTFSLVEYPDPEACSWIYTHPQIEDSQRLLLFNYTRRLTEQGVPVTYQQRLIDGVPLGRYYPTLPMTAIGQKRRIRATLFAESEEDVDIVNCHFTLVKCHANRLQISTPCLDRYIERRDDIINQTMISRQAIERYNAKNLETATKRDVVKDLYVIQLYGGSKETWMKRYELSADEFTLESQFQNFVNEMVTIRRSIINCNNPVIVDLVSHIRKGIKPAPHEGQILSYLMQHDESRIILRAIEFFSQLPGVMVTAYCYDGFQVRRTDGKKPDGYLQQVDQWLRELEKIIERELLFSIKFLRKPFDAALTPFVSDDGECPYLQRLFEFMELPTNRTLEQLIRSTLGGSPLVVIDNESYIYKEGIWVIDGLLDVQAQTNDKLMDRVKADIIKYLPIKESTPDDDGRTGDKLALDRMRLFTLKQYVDTDRHWETAYGMIRKHHRKTVELDDKHHLLNAPNGTFNFEANGRKGELQRHNPEDYLTRCIKYPIEEAKINEDSLQRLIDFMFDYWGPRDPTEEDTQLYQAVIRYHLAQLAIGLDGSYQREFCNIWLGPGGGNGKTSIIDCLKTVFGSYLGTLKMSYLTAEDGSKDAPSPTYMTIMGVRYLVFEEAGDSGNARIKIDNATFRGLTGRTPIPVRDNYAKSKSVKLYTPRFTTILVCNDPPAFRKTADEPTYRRLHCTDFPCSFVDAPLPVNKKDNRFCKPKDPYYKSKIEAIAPLVVPALIHLRATLLVEGKIVPPTPPDSVKKFQEQALGLLDEVLVWAHSELEISNNSSDYVVLNEHLWQIFKAKENNTQVKQRDFIARLEKAYDLYLAPPRHRTPGNKSQAKHLVGVRHRQLEDECRV